jgi:hypothetical protein
VSARVTLPTAAVAMGAAIAAAVAVVVPDATASSARMLDSAPRVAPLLASASFTPTLDSAPRTMLRPTSAGSSQALVPTPPPAPPPTSASISPSLTPDRPGARAALTLTIGYTGGEFGVPSPVRRAVLRMPAGMSLYMPSLHSCQAARLRARGASGCSARSRIGSGRALVETRTGSQIVGESIALRAFLGPPDNLRPTLEILAQGHTPLDERVVFSGSVRDEHAPYGEALVLSIPPVATLPLAPDASILTLSLTVGASMARREDSAVLVPKRCPAGGFPFAATFTYADGSTGNAAARVPCPSAHLARTIALNETGRLRLTSKHNFTLNEVGSASGTAVGTIYVHLTAVSSSRVTAQVAINTHAGSLSGHGAGTFRRNGAQASFSGSMSIDGGTGSYAHVHGSGLSFSGTIDESHDDAIAVHVRGSVSD